MQNLSKSTLIWVVVAIVIVGAFFIFNSYIYNEKQGDNFGTEQDNELVDYFAQQMFETATEDGLIPIEGFDADLLLGAYPGLSRQDFEGVKSFEGIYSFTDSALIYTRTQSSPVSSAERTISAKGYGTLLSNISGRLSLPVGNETEIDIIIEKIR